MAASPNLLIVGTGLIGASLGLAARAAGYHVGLDDRDPARLDVAERVGAGTRVSGAAESPAELAVVAVSPHAIGGVAGRLLKTNAASHVSHVGSVQLLPQAEVEALGALVNRFVGSHPIAGSERSGPAHASPDLFRSRPWVICPGPETAPAAAQAITDLALACGADPIRLRPAEHDAIFARLSHLPQLVASALAGSVLDLAAADAALTGSGLRDTTRIADSDPRLWGEIISGNVTAVAQALRAVLSPLQELAGLLEQAPSDQAAVQAAVESLISTGRQGRALFAGKHGERAVDWTTVAVVVPDQPGALARLLADAATSGVNVEDIHVDHTPGHPQGVVELAVDPAGQATLQSALERQGWTITSGPPLQR